MTERLKIEFAYASEEKQILLDAEVMSGTSARAAIMASSLASEFPAVDFSTCPIGIWGKPVADDFLVREGDRLEAYRVLKHDPREFRRELAREGRFMGAGSRDK